MVIYLITGSQRKFQEIQEFLKDTIEIEMLSLDLDEIQEVDAKKIIKHKLNEALKHHPGKEFFVEDTSLHFECLNGLPGPLIKWFLKKMNFDELHNLCEKMGDNKATAKVHIGYHKDGKIHFFEGHINGNIVAKGLDNGFGWDVIFQPEGFNKRFSEMTIEEKNKISHRANAVKKFKEFLESN